MIPIRFVYLEDGEKVYTSILGRFVHHFTGKTIYKVRLEGESGWFNEYLYDKEIIDILLKKRVDE